jgi:hypothetical protein
LKAPVNRLFTAVVPLIAVFLLFSTAAYAAGNFAPQAEVGDTRVLELAFFSAKPTGRGVVLSWRTGPESNLQGFNVYRAQGASEWERLNPELIVATGGLSERNDYAWTDASAKAGQSYFYRLEHLTGDGSLVDYEPLRVKAGAPLRLGLNELDGRTLATLWPAMLGALVAVGGFSLVNRRRS